MLKDQLLIDADIMLYEVCNAVEFAQDYGNDVWVLSANLGEAKTQVLRIIGGYMTRFSTNDFLLFISDRENFRKELTDTYKAQRKATRKPLIFPEMVKWLREEFTDQVVTLPKLEADDAMGIYMTEPSKVFGLSKDSPIGNRIMISADKDMQTIPGKLWRQGQLIETSEEQADRFWLIQTLTGDPTDGYKGCPGVGPVKAEKILGAIADFGSVERAYEASGMAKADALLNARLARILRWNDWDHEKQQVKLWEPKYA